MERGETHLPSPIFPTELGDGIPSPERELPRSSLGEGRWRVLFRETQFPSPISATEFPTEMQTGKVSPTSPPPEEGRLGEAATSPLRRRCRRSDLLGRELRREGVRRSPLLRGAACLGVDNHCAEGWFSPLPPRFVAQIGTTLSPPLICRTPTPSSLFLSFCNRAEGLFPQILPQPLQLHGC